MIRPWTAGRRAERFAWFPALAALAVLGDAGGGATGAAQAQTTPPAAAGPSAAGPSAAGSSVTRDTQAGSDRRSGEESAPFAFSSAAFDQLESESLLDSLHVVYGSGLPPEAVPVRRTSEGPWITLGDVARITGGAFRWNPRTWKGSFAVDTVEVGFSLDSPVVWVRGTPVQLPAPARYADETVLLPLGVIDGVIGPLLRSRCQWNPGTGELHLAGRPPWLETLVLSGTEFQAALLLAPIDPERLRLRWDPMGTLFVEGRGPRLRPDAATSIGRTDGIQVLRARTTGRGFEIALRLDARWVGLRLRPARGERSVALDFTARAPEVYRGSYRPLVSWIAPRPARVRDGGIGRTILVEVTPPPGAAGLKGDCLLRLADALKRSLETEFGHRVVPVADRGENSSYRSPSGLPETPAAPEGDCWIGLRLESRRPGTEGEFGLVVARPIPRRAPLGLGALARDAGAVPEEPPEGVRGAEGFDEIPPWGQVARMEQAASERLARTLADHIDDRWADRPVRIHARPSRVFRGLGMPAVLVYPAAIDDESALDALCDSIGVGELARNLAFGVDEFLMTRMSAED